MNPDTEFFIRDDDGWSLDGYFAAVPGLHGEVRFTYRPLTPGEKNYTLHKISSTEDPEVWTRFLNDVLSTRLKSWSLGLEITADNIGTLRPASLWERFLAVVVHGVEGGDIDPKASQEEKGFRGNVAMDQALTGRSRSEAATGVLEKNSGPA